jgi:IMP dehydrogenase
MASRPGQLRIREASGLTFDDVLLVPRYSTVHSRKAVDTRTRFSRGIELRMPIVSSNMDTVTESEMAIAMARAGGIGVIHRFMRPERQSAEVRRVKRAEALVVKNPLTVPPDATIAEARNAMEGHGIGGAVVVDPEGLVLGIVTRRDVMFATDDVMPVSAVMTPRERLVTAPKGTTFDEARSIIDRARKEKLPLVDEQGRLAGLITAKDIEQLMHYPDATKDAKGHLRVAAAVGIRSGFLERARLLLEAGADALVVDIAHGDSSNAVDSGKALRREFGDEWDLVIGNVATAEGTERLLDIGSDAVKVGVGPGSFCITRLVTGFGVP